MENFTGIMHEGAIKLGLAITAEQIAQMEFHWRLVNAANRKINLTAIEGEAEAAEKHYLDSLLPLLLSLKPNLALDLGSGAGFPGLPLAICRPDWNWILLDSQEKRGKFLKQAVIELALANCRVIVSRAEEVGRGILREACDLVTARAVGSLNLLAEYALPILKIGGYFLALKGPALDSELKLAQGALAILGGEIIERREFVLPFCFEKRSLLLIKKVEQTPEKYPRRLAAKKPIVSRETSRYLSPNGQSHHKMGLQKTRRQKKWQTNATI